MGTPERSSPQDADGDGKSICYADPNMVSANNPSATRDSPLTCLTFSTSPSRPSASFPSVPDPIPSISVIEYLEQDTCPWMQSAQGTPASHVDFDECLGVSLSSLFMLASANELAFDAPASSGRRRPSDSKCVTV